MQVEKKIQAMELSLPKLTPPAGNYVRAVRVGNLVFLAGTIAKGDKGIVRGKLGQDITIEEAYEGTKLAALSLLAVLKEEIGDLDNVKRIVKLLCFVNATPTFHDLAKVSNGASDLLVTLYGESGKHARSTVGMASLGSGACAEIEMIVELS